MFRNYLITAIRNILKHKAFSLINVLGLAIGIAACLLIIQYVRLELSYDNFHTNGSNLYRIQQDRYNEGKLSTQWAAGAAGIGPAMKNALPEVEAITKLYRTGGVISYNDNKFREERMYFANENLLTMFSYPLVKGNASNALSEPNSAAISESTAKKYFGDEDPMGKIIRRNNNEQYKITAILKDPPLNTHLKFDILLSFKTFLNSAGPEAETTFNWDGFYTYVLLKEGTDPQKTEQKISALIDRLIGADMKTRNEEVKYRLQPVKDIHLYSAYMMEAEVNGDGNSVYFLLMIALFIVFIAWINYINLSTARSLERAREVGVRKVLGSHRSQLITQFLFESVLINFLAILLAIIIILISLPLFNSLTGKEIGFGVLANGFFWFATAVLFVAGTIFSGIYPALVLSSFKPIAVLKGKLSKSKHGAFLRHSLVIVQFAASVALMVGTYSVYAQLNYMQKQELGINIGQTLVLRGPAVTDSTYQDKLSSFKTEMIRTAAIINMAASTDVPGNKVGWNAGGIGIQGSGPGSTNQYRIIGIDYDFLETFGLKMITGRPFSKEFSTDRNAVLFNQAAINLLGFRNPEDALNKKIDFWGDVYTIVGVVANHHQESLKQDYDAHIFRLIPEAENYYSIKIREGENLPAVIEKAEQEWNRFFPGNPFEFFFLDEYYNKQYLADQQFGKTFALFAGLAIFVACLGLFGLASFLTSQRTKEIGIRKISGAGVTSIVVLLTRDFLKPVLISFLIAFPITYFLIKMWLGNYAFKVDINAWMFIIPAIAILAIALITISRQTVHAATSNPVKSLRSE